jgi:hypothetical protein
MTRESRLLESRRDERVRGEAIRQGGLVLGRKGTPKKASAVSTDRSRIDAHIKPLLGQLKAREVRRSDIETFKIGVATGTTARDVKLGKQRRSIVRGARVRWLGRLASWARSSPGAWRTVTSSTTQCAA